jgi:hypothetical protein
MENEKKTKLFRKRTPNTYAIGTIVVLGAMLAGAFIQGFFFKGSGGGSNFICGDFEIEKYNSGNTSIVIQASSNPKMKNVTLYFNESIIFSINPNSRSYYNDSELDTTSLSEGFYNVCLYVQTTKPFYTNSCQSEEIIIDNTDPISVTDHIYKVGVNNVTFIGEFEDSVSGINLNKSYITWIDPNSDKENRIMVNSTKYNFSQLFTKGTYEFTTHIEDMAGNTYINQTIIDIPYCPNQTIICENQSYIVSYPSEVQLNKNGTINIQLINITEFELFENYISILYNTESTEINVSSPTEETRFYQIFMNSSCFTNLEVNFTIDFVNHTIVNYNITEINITEINIYIEIFYPTVILINQTGNITLNFLNISHILIFENNILIENITESTNISIISTDEVNKTYSIWIYDLDNNLINFLEFKIQFIEPKIIEEDCNDVNISSDLWLLYIVITAGLSIIAGYSLNSTVLGKKRGRD